MQNGLYMQSMLNLKHLLGIKQIISSKVVFAKTVIYLVAKENLVNQLRQIYLLYIAMNANIYSHNILST